jgi:plastocyanin
MHISRLSAIAVTSLLALAACGSDSYSNNDSGGTSPPVTVADDAAAPAGGDSITIKGFTFTALDATAGATVQITNEDGTAHTVTADDGGFDVKVDGGGTGSFTAPATPGSYSFHCNIHSSMTGTLVVG